MEATSATMAAEDQTTADHGVSGSCHVCIILRVFAPAVSP